MKCIENPTEARRRISRLNRYIVALALLWIATGVALLLVADTAHARVTHHSQEASILQLATRLRV